MVETDKQIDLFSTIVKILLNNDTIKSRFKKSDFYEIEEKPKSLNLSIPYIVINIPTTSTSSLTLKSLNTTKTFNIVIELVMDYLARDKVKLYITEIINSIELNQNTFFKLGYSNLIIDSEQPREELLSQKQVIRTTFNLSVDGLLKR